MSYSNGLLSDQSYQTANKYEQGLPGVGFKLTDTGDYDMQNKKLTNTKEGTLKNDVVTKLQLDNKTTLIDGARPSYITNNKAVIYSGTGAVHAKSFYLQDYNEDEVRILTDNQDFDNVHLFVPNLKNFDGFGGRKRSEIMITSVDQIISGNKYFQNIKAQNPTEDGDVANKNYVDFEITKQNVLIDNEFVKKSGSLMTGDLILPHYNYPVQGNTNKAISYETQREIFISRKESWPMEVDLNMNNNLIQNVKDPVNSDHGANKKYVDDQISTKVDLAKTTTQIFQSRVQVPDFNSGQHNGSDVVNLKYINDTFLSKKTGGTMNNPINFSSSLPDNQKQILGLGPPQFNSNAINKKYVDSEIGKIATVNTTQFIKRDGTVAMIANLDMGTHKIENVKTPTNDMDVATKSYIDNTLAKSHFVSSHKTNAFKYLDDTSSEYNITVNAFTDFNESPHRNKKAFEITLQKEAGSNNYRSRMGFNLYPQDIGTYTIIFEFFPPEMTNIQLSCQATTAYVHKQVQKDFTNYSKLLVQINNNSKDTPDYIFFTMHGTAVVSPVQGYIIVYGVKDWSDSVDPSVYDSDFNTQMFEYRDGGMYMNSSIDLNFNHRIVNVPQPRNPTDLLMKMSVSIFNIPLYGTVLCKNNKSEFRRISTNIGENSRYFEGNEISKKFRRNFEALLS